jgi:hypothetical protein
VRGVGWGLLLFLTFCLHVSILFTLQLTLLPMGWSGRRPTERDEVALHDGLGACQMLKG